MQITDVNPFQNMRATKGHSMNDLGWHGNKNIKNKNIKNKRNMTYDMDIQWGQFALSIRQNNSVNSVHVTCRLLRCV